MKVKKKIKREDIQKGATLQLQDDDKVFFVRKASVKGMVVIIRHLQKGQLEVISENEIKVVLENDECEKNLVRA
jgi:hypothetical protein